MAATLARCENCGSEFMRWRSDHRFCSSFCRRRSTERSPHKRRNPADPDQIARLFDETRDPEERVRPDDWCANMPPEYAALYADETVAARRGWYLTLSKMGRV